MINDTFLTSVVLIAPSEQDLAKIDTLVSEVTDWDLTFKLLMQHGSAPLLYNKLPQLKNAHLIPSSIQTQLQQVYLRTMSRSMLLYNAFVEVLTQLQGANIQVVALKGIYLSAALYSDIALRQLSDIDILVPEKEGEQAVKLLQSIGYVPHDPSVSAFISTQTEIVHYPPLIRNGISIEVHIRLHRTNSAYAINTQYMLENAIYWQYKDLKLHTLDLNNLLVHLCVHIDKHFVGGHIQMKCFNDIANIIRIRGKEIDWQALKACCQVHACEQLVFKNLLLTAEFYDVELPPEITKTYAHNITNDLKHRFISYLHCEYEDKYHIGTHLQNMQHINSSWKKTRYFLELIFPPKAFMVQKYGIKQKSWWLWYPYRWYVGLKSIFLFKVKE